ncbi:hypothetical protein PSFL111601_13870 [Pseudomonas floridensis]
MWHSRYMAQLEAGPSQKVEQIDGRKYYLQGLSYDVRK